MNKPLKQVEIFTDGACKGNPGPGGWGAILRFDGRSKEIHGGASLTTNNIMELTAVIEALARLNEPCKVIVTTDSVYVRNGITQWIHTWKKNGWITSNKKPVKNKELWILLDKKSRVHEISWNWVRGHTGHPENERADQLANLGIPA